MYWGGVASRMVGVSAAVLGAAPAGARVSWRRACRQMRRLASSRCIISTKTSSEAIDEIVDEIAQKSEARPSDAPDAASSSSYPPAPLSRGAASAAAELPALRGGDVEAAPQRPPDETVLPDVPACRSTPAAVNRAVSCAACDPSAAGGSTRGSHAATSHPRRSRRPRSASASAAPSGAMSKAVRGFGRAGAGVASGGRSEGAY